jgi:hypothetical protein
MSHEQHPEVDPTDIGERLRAERPEVTPLELDRIKQTVLSRASRGSQSRGHGRSRLASVLVAGAVMVGGTGLVIAATSGGNGNGATNSQYCPPTSQNPGGPKGHGHNCGHGGDHGDHGVKGIDESGNGNGGDDSHPGGTPGGPTAPPVQNSGASTSTSTGTAPPAELTRQQAVREAKRALRKKYGEKFTDAEDREIDCRRNGPDGFRCAVEWSYGDADYKGRVKVSPPADDPVVVVKVKKK